MIIDLHNHTNRHSRCSIISPEELVETYIARHIDGLCITEHNYLWNREDREWLVKRYGDKIALFFGIEVDTDAGHVLVFSERLEEFRAPLPIPLNALDRYFPARRSAFIWAHPYRWTDFSALDEERLRYFDAVELYNGNLTNEKITYTYKYLSPFEPVFTGGSDTHSQKMCGVYGTLFEKRITSQQELVAALKEKAIKPCLL